MTSVYLGRRDCHLSSTDWHVLTLGMTSPTAPHAMLCTRYPILTRARIRAVHVHADDISSIDDMSLNFYH